MNENRERPGLSMRVAVFIALVSIVGLVWTAYLVKDVEWSPSTLGELTLFTTLVILAGNFPLRVGPAVKTDVTAAALFGAALVLEPGVAALVGALGITIYTLSIRFWGTKLTCPR